MQPNFNTHDHCSASMVAGLNGWCYIGSHQLALVPPPGKAMPPRVVKISQVVAEQIERGGAQCNETAENAISRGECGGPLRIIPTTQQPLAHTGQMTKQHITFTLVGR